MADVSKTRVVYTYFRNELKNKIGQKVLYLVTIGHWVLDIDDLSEE